MILAAWIATVAAAFSICYLSLSPAVAREETPLRPQDVHLIAPLGGGGGGAGGERWLLLRAPA